MIGSIFSNVPPQTHDYVPRPKLENLLRETLSNNRHPVITLHGRGGIGKTSLALAVLHEIFTEQRFEFVFWFSARDIDLMTVGPKVVKPHVLTEKDVAEEFVRLIQPEYLKDRTFRSTDFLAKCMSTLELGAPALFVFDNFETVRNPIDLFQWIDANIRLPNKILITTRFREFKADFPIEVPGMERPEALKLLERTAHTLGVTALMTDDFQEEVYEEADGHPYVMKIVLGEVASEGRRVRPRQIVARKDEILGALFERTFVNLSPAARRIFLTLSRWRSLIPQLALEAIILRPQNERMDVAQAIDELLRMSLVQRMEAADGADFLYVPFAAAAFGVRKFNVSPLQRSIEEDLDLLRALGTTSETQLKDGINPKIRQLFKRIADTITAGTMSLEDASPMLELIARNYPRAWLLLGFV